MFQHKESNLDLTNRLHRRAGYTRLINDIRKWHYYSKDKFYNIVLPFSSMKLINHISITWNLNITKLGTDSHGQILLERNRTV